MKQTKPTPNTPKMPTFISMNQASAQTGIPLPFLKRAKKLGCDGFANARVDLAKFLHWYFAQPERSEAGINWRTELTMEQAKREKIKRMAEEGQTIETAIVQQSLNTVMLQLFHNLDRVFVTQFPASVKGMNEQTIHQRAKEHIEKFREAIKKEFSRVAPAKEESK